MHDVLNIQPYPSRIGSELLTIRKPNMPEPRDCLIRY